MLKSKERISMSDDEAVLRDDSRRAQPVGEEILPGPDTVGVVGSQVGAGPKCAGGLTRQPDRYDQPTLVIGVQVPAQQIGHGVRPRPTELGHLAGGLAESA